MSEECVLIFDVGKTHKKVLVFDRRLRPVRGEERVFGEVQDDDGFPCEDAEALEGWMDEKLEQFLHRDGLDVKGLNVTTYGATLVWLGRDGSRAGPVYNYLKPMPEDVTGGFYEAYGGPDEFSRCTASPLLGLLNAGLQILWVKKKKPDLFRRAAHILHFPQYLSCRYTGKIAAEHTSIGCHTALWDFDRMAYHRWTEDYGIRLPVPVDPAGTVPFEYAGRSLVAGTGIHDSSASLVPYLKASPEPFILVSTGTWCISMNPFNHKPLTLEELKQDCLCYLSIGQKPVKSSRFFLGRIHDLNVERVETHFGKQAGYYKSVRPRRDAIRAAWARERRCFFREGIPEGYLDTGTDLNAFNSFEEAYLQLLYDLTQHAIGCIKLVTTVEAGASRLYVAGGFSRNRCFTGFLALAFPDMQVYTTGISNATSLGALMAIAGHIWPDSPDSPDLDLRPVDM